MQTRQSTNSCVSRRDLLRAGVGTGVAAAVVAGSGRSGLARQETGVVTYDGPSVTLEFWNGLTGADGPFMLEMIKQFNTAHENIDVKMNAIPWDEFYQKVPAAVASGRGPDLGLMHIRSLATNAARQVIVPLDDVAAGLELDEEDFSPGRWQSVQYDDHVYGIPLDLFVLGYYYNATTMEQAGLDTSVPPQDHDPYMAALQQAKADGIAIQWQAPVTSLWQRFSTLLWQFGGDLFNADVTEAVYNSEAGVQALSWLVSLIQEGYSPENLGPDAEVLGFKNNENGFHWNGPWMINNFGAVEGLQWGLAPMPVIGQGPASWSEGHNFVMLRQRRQDENKLRAAQVFIEWVVANAAQWAGSGQVPALNRARETSDFEALPEQSTLATQLPHVHFPPTVPGIENVLLEPINAELNQALLLKKAPQDALDDAVSLANQLLEENRSKY